ncbi:DNA-3-methyladenine glycosylase family protein [Natronincola ferrireducens]|uniref:DNA-(apurinic or apyrimidinic site) lyase n=1 Tax=Natronincola ferrireducens TaxID=393762 RepID=A0A1G8XXS7_9FIRM|nr:DNA glycosylase [Natronincola ferrireducens]SDJ94964.1 N-glycosylase/DNA lyase [Natronincola ferrireducens]
MRLDIVYKNKEVIIKDVKDFEPQHVFECGQCFRWTREEDGSYTGVAFKQVINVKKVDNDLIILNTTKEDFIDIWMDYFDLTTDYGAIKERLTHGDHIMKRAVAFGNGIRILQQEPWETLISFIISSNNNIPRIKGAIELLCQRYGEYLGEFWGEKRYSFPEPQVLAALRLEEITACGTGYRAPYIQHTSCQVIKALDEFMSLKKLDLQECQKKLMNYQGVGPKVAHCILFFSMGKMEAFPVDVWVKRIMEHLYFNKETPAGVIQEFARERYGEYAGYGQQYLFYYARELGIGKK